MSLRHYYTAIDSPAHTRARFPFTPFDSRVPAAFSKQLFGFQQNHFSFLVGAEFCFGSYSPPPLILFNLSSHRTPLKSRAVISTPHIHKFFSIPHTTKFYLEISFPIT